MLSLRDRLIVGLMMITTWSIVLAVANDKNNSTRTIYRNGTASNGSTMVNKTRHYHSRKTEILEYDMDAESIDLGSCGSSLTSTKLPCASTGTCESFPLTEQTDKCRRRYCPINKVYCLDFDGCMLPDPVYIPSSSKKKEPKKCPMPFSLCVSRKACQYVQRKNFSDVKEPSLDVFNCTLFARQLIFNNSTCSANSDCSWTSKCCPDGRMNKQCVSYNRSMSEPLLSSPSSSDLSSSSSSSTNPSTGRETDMTTTISRYHWTDKETEIEAVLTTSGTTTISTTTLRAEPSDPVGHETGSLPPEKNPLDGHGFPLTNAPDPSSESIDDKSDQKSITESLDHLSQNGAGPISPTEQKHETITETTTDHQTNSTASSTTTVMTSPVTPERPDDDDSSPPGNANEPFHPSGSSTTPMVSSLSPSPRILTSSPSPGGSSSTPGGSNKKLAVKSATILMTNDYNVTIGNNKSEFISTIRKQLAKLLNLTEGTFTKMEAKPGSIILDLEMSPSPDEPAKVDQAAAKLSALLENGTLSLKDQNKNGLTIPPQANGQLIEPKSYTTVILAVTGASLGITFLLMLWILWTNKKKQGVDPLQEDRDDAWLKNSEHVFGGSEPGSENGNIARNGTGLFTLNDPQAQWDFFQKSFDKPGYVWNTGSGRDYEWPANINVDVPESKLAPNPARYEEPIPDSESKHI